MRAPSVMAFLYPVTFGEIYPPEWVRTSAPAQKRPPNASDLERVIRQLTESFRKLFPDDQPKEWKFATPRLPGEFGQENHSWGSLIRQGLLLEQVPHLGELARVLQRSRRLARRIYKSSPTTTAAVIGHLEMLLTHPWTARNDNSPASRYELDSIGGGTLRVVCATPPPSEWLNSLVNDVEIASALSRFVPNDVQNAILKALDGRALRQADLAEATGIDPSQLHRDGLRELKKLRLILHHRRLGYFDPNRPPPQLRMKQIANHLSFRVRR